MAKGVYEIVSTAAFITAVLKDVCGHIAEEIWE